MELRRVEEELKGHCRTWKELCRVGKFRPKVDDDSTAVSLPTLKALFSRINDDNIFPPPPEEELEEMEDEKSDKECSDETNNIEQSISAAESKPISSSSESNNAQSPNEYMMIAEDEEDVAAGEEESLKQVLNKLEKLNEKISILEPKMNKFLLRLVEKDPVTLKPRYGEKTIIRVKDAVRAYKALELGLSEAFGEDTPSDNINQSTLVSNLRQHVQRKEQELNEQRQALQAQEQMELERIKNENELAQKQQIEQRLLEEQRKREEEMELARRAEEARRRRVEEEELTLAAEREADAALLASVPTKGPEGVREQIVRMRLALKDDRAAFDAALSALYTLFDQINRRPEEVSFRRVRRDHPKFNEDIGRHAGGKEVLIAAGFCLETIDGVKCFFSREPNIETDMDGWSKWFDVLKKTLEVIEEEMLK
ncbi:hypothetical protein ACHAWC_003548 [Mediolabrus comicus]|jgi:hypothetical protein